jgi:threonine dehydrogenase-like Zn-dependent dehydrogenase
VGAGTVGLTLLLTALRYGGSSVQIADRSADRRNAVARIAPIDAAPALVGEFDVVFDAVGSAGAREAAMQALAPGGTAVWIGLHDEVPGFEARAAVRAEHRVQCSFGYTDSDFRAAIALLPKVDPSWVTCVPLDGGIPIFHELMDGRTDLVKVQLVP